MKTFLITALTWASLTVPAWAERLSLGEISSYLNSLQQAQGGFTQINDDGTISTGTFSLKRPGRARFEYNPPEPALVMIGANAVAVFDTKMKSVEQFPLEQTPLKIILARRVNLGRSGMVTATDYDGTATTITAQDPDNPDYGNIQLVFTANPTELRQWKINGQDGSATTVVLGALNTSINLPDSLFNVPVEVEKYRR